MAKRQSPIRTGATPPIGKAPTPYDLMQPSQRPKTQILHGDLNVKYPPRNSSPGGKVTKPGPGMGSVITGSSRRPDEMDRSSMPNAGRRSDVIRDNPDRLRRSHVCRMIPKARTN
jgi:hypothetical protein